MKTKQIYVGKKIHKLYPLYILKNLPAFNEFFSSILKNFSVSAAHQDGELLLGDPRNLRGSGIHPEALHDAGLEVGQLPQLLGADVTTVGQDLVQFPLKLGLHLWVLGEVGD